MIKYVNVKSAVIVGCQEFMMSQKYAPVVKVNIGMRMMIKNISYLIGFEIFKSKLINCQRGLNAPSNIPDQLESGG